MTYQDLRQKVLDSITNWLSYNILDASQELVYHPPVHPHGTKAMFTVYADESAICCTEQEAMLLYKLTKKIQPNLFIEIGSYAGWSTAFICKAMTIGSNFIAVDNFSECKKPELVKSILLNQIYIGNKSINSWLIASDSTEFLNSLVEQKADVIFIDGFHREGKPLQDVKAATKALKPDGYIILRDTWMPDVNKTCEWLVEQGFQSWTFTTDNQLEIYTKGDLSWIKEIAV